MSQKSTPKWVSPVGPGTKSSTDSEFWPDRPASAARNGPLDPKTRNTACKDPPKFVALRNKAGRRMGNRLLPGYQDGLVRSSGEDDRPADGDGLSEVGFWVCDVACICSRGDLSCAGLAGVLLRR